LTGRRGNLIASSVQYVLNVVFTSTFTPPFSFLPVLTASLVPAIIYIDKWGRRPLLLVGTLFMGFFMYLVGGLQGSNGAWGLVDGNRESTWYYSKATIYIPAGVWVITNHDSITKGVIVCSYFFVCSFAISMGPVSWTYPAEIFPMRVRAKAVSASTATTWYATCLASPPSSHNH
jgi:MFS family permease